MKCTHLSTRWESKRRASSTQPMDKQSPLVNVGLAGSGTDRQVCCQIGRNAARAELFSWRIRNREKGHNRQSLGQEHIPDGIQCGQPDSRSFHILARRMNTVGSSSHSA